VPDVPLFYFFNMMWLDIRRLFAEPPWGDNLKKQVGFIFECNISLSQVER